MRSLDHASGTCVPLPHSLAVLLEQFGTGLGGLFANPLVPIGKYWVAVATAYGLFQHILHSKFGIGDVALSLPSVLNANGVKKVMDLSMTDEELILLHHSAEQLQRILEAVKDI